MTLRSAAWIAVAIAAAALVLLIVWRPAFSPRAPSPPPAIGGPFHLVDQDGKPVDQSVLKGKWSAVYFGYTYCPDVCPTTLQMLGQAEQSLGDKAKDFRVVFVSVDPARDTPAQMKLYLSNGGFPKGAIGLTGTDAEVSAAAHQYGVYYQKQGSGSAYLVNHSSVIYLMNPAGGFDSVISSSVPPDEAKAAILKAMQG